MSNGLIIRVRVQLLLLYGAGWLTGDSSSYGGGGGSDELGEKKKKKTTRLMRAAGRGVMYPPAPAPPPNGFFLPFVAAVFDTAEGVARRVVPERAADAAIGAGRNNHDRLLSLVNLSVNSASSL